ncbi:MAG TPA: DUF371 domain-containing protein [Mycobacteriales bacterium]
MTPVRLTAAGHPAVTGRHDKTLELTAAGSITARATCILAVSAGPLPGGLPMLRERVRLTLSAGRVSAAVEGEVNPGWHSAESLIARRSGRLDADTYLANATAAAVDLPAELLAALRDPAATVEVRVEEVGTPTPVVLVLTGGPATDEIARLAAQADLVVDLTARGAPPPPVPLTAPRRHGVPTGEAARTTVVLTEDPAAALPLTAGNRVVLWPPNPGADLLLSAGRPPTPLLQAGTANRDLARLLAATPAPALVDLAGADPAELAPDHTVLADAPELGWGVRATDGAHARHVVLVPRATDKVGVEAAELARLLRAAGRSGRDTAAELARLGVPRREAYRLAADSGRDPR